MHKIDYCNLGENKNIEVIKALHFNKTLKVVNICIFLEYLTWKINKATNSFGEAIQTSPTNEAGLQIAELIKTNDSLVSLDICILI